MQTVSNSDTGSKVYVSITGLLLKRPWHAPRFWWHAARSMRQAQQADGNLRAEARTVAGVHHTLTVWRSAADMRAFLVAGAHGRAMKAFPAIGTGKTLGFRTDRVPTWDEVPGLWRSKGKQV